jgi:catechol 2,3-dioxygenase-like lactoylglutathione lyase family enzyme
MSAEFNHTIVRCRDQEASATFLAEMLGCPPPSRFASFHVVELDNRVSLDFLATHETIAPQHYAFLMSENDFDEVFTRIGERGIRYWADPGQTREGQINRNDGGRGFYFEDPDGHLLEAITRPYGSGEQ